MRALALSTGYLRSRQPGADPENRENSVAEPKNVLDETSLRIILEVRQRFGREDLQAVELARVRVARIEGALVPESNLAWTENAGLMVKHFREASGETVREGKRLRTGPDD